MKEDIVNTGIIHPGCAQNRLLKFQGDNPAIKLKQGDLIMMGFPVNPDKPDDDDKEWMWLQVEVFCNEHRKGGGVLANDPLLSPFKIGDVFTFEYHEICKIEKE